MTEPADVLAHQTLPLPLPPSETQTQGEAVPAATVAAETELRQIETTADSPTIATPSAEDGLPDDVVEPTISRSARKFYDDKVAVVRKFWRTRKAVLAGEPLWDFTPAQLKAYGYYSGARFNLAESTLAAAPGVVAGRVIDFLLPNPVVLTRMEKIQGSIAATVYGALVPFVLLFAARSIARSTFRKGEGSPDMVQRAKRAYLYLEGARSFTPELILATGVSIMAAFPRLSGQPSGGSVMVAGVVAIVSLLAILISTFLLGRIVTVRIPRQLFVLNGYSDRRLAWWKLWTKDRTIGPWNRYYTASRVKVPLMIVGFAILINLVAFGIAEILVWLRP